MPTPTPSSDDLQPSDKRSRLRTDTLASSVLILLIATVVQRSVGFGRGVFFCRWLSPETLGQWEMAYSFLLLAAPLAVLGVPGSFGRYLEHYRQRGYLHTFLLRTSVWTALFSSAAVAMVVSNAPLFSRLLFGSEESTNLLRGIAFCLAAVIVHHTLSSLLTALRLFRVVSVMNFLQSLLFACVALGLLLVDASVSSIVTGYGIACLCASLGAMAWVWPGLREVERPVDHLPQSQFWPRLLRFAFFVWLSNLLTHLFAVVDRYMIIHYSGMNPVEALEQVGHYHSSRIVPLLLVSVADLLSGMILPHLSHDWETGRRKQVGKLLNLSIKLSAIAMLAFGFGVLLFAPLLFNVVFAGKYADGLGVLPWTLAGCIWYGIYLVSCNYLWCAERTRLATLPLGLGLLLNVGLNLLLLPVWGLLGAVIATATSTLLCLVVLLFLSSQHGMELGRGTWILIAAPVTLTFGTTMAGIVLAALLLATLGTTLILTNAERDQLQGLLAQILGKLKPLRLRKSSATGTV
ncbi:MAG: lipopolysaccharide biosynthesis protein [Planctomycetales bacterium]|nr:lipopolysaccharide biosynthesis protein [Planctomycetales bacterium]